MYRETGRHELSEREFDRALAIHREVGNRRFEGINSCDLAQLVLSMGRVEEAKRLATLGMRLLREVGEVRELARKTADLRASFSAAGLPPLVEEAP